MNPQNVPELFRASCARWGDAPALRTRTGLAWIARSWADWLDASLHVAMALGDLGVAPGDRVALLSRARREGAEAALGVALAGAVLVPLPWRCEAEVLGALLDDAGARVLIVDDPATLERLVVRASRGAVLHVGLRALRRVVMLDTRASRPARDTRGRVELRLDDVLPHAERARVMTWNELLTAGRNLRARRDTPTALSPASEAIFARVFTARPGRLPRAVDLTHGQVVASAHALVGALPVGPGDEQLAVASLSSAFGLAQLVTAARAGVATAFADPSRPTEAQLAEVQPTLVAAQPAFFARLRDAALERVRGMSPLRRTVVDRALSVGHQVASLTRAGVLPGAVLRAEHRLARATALDALAATFGARLRFALSVGAPLPVGVAEWFHACGVLVLEGYGLTEAAGFTHVNRPASYRFGAVGKALPGVSARIDGGEIVLRGPMIRGELRTSDRGSLDADGYLTVRGRVDESS